MYKITQLKKVTWPVDVQIPQDGGKVQKVRFTGMFEIILTKEYDEITASGDDILKRTLVGWGNDVPRTLFGSDNNLPNEEGDVRVPYSDEAKEELLQVPYVRVGLVTAYLQAASGREAPRKN